MHYFGNYIHGIFKFWKKAAAFKQRLSLLPSRSAIPVVQDIQIPCAVARLQEQALPVGGKVGKFGAEGNPFNVIKLEVAAVIRQF